MPMSSSVLSTAMRAAILASDAGAEDNAALTALCDAISQTVVDHVTANATVAVPALGLVAPTGGGPVTGAATGSVT